MPVLLIYLIYKIYPGGRTLADPQPIRISVLYSGEFGKKVLGNLINSDQFCTSCGEACDHCRQGRKSYSGFLTEIHELPADLPEFVEEPEEYLPADLKPCDLFLAMDLHPDLFAGLPTVAKKAHAKGVIAPVENPKLAPAGLVRQVAEKLQKEGIEYAFPKPFCSLEKTGQHVIDRFVEIGFGKPKIEIILDNEEITTARVIRDAPCGCTWFVARKLVYTEAADFKETVSSAHHAYPCTASMDNDPEIGDTILHKAGYIVRESVGSALDNAQKENTNAR
jgi:hypothetical protein